MRCDRVCFLYDEYSQGALPVSTVNRIEEHLAACPACSDFFEQSDAIGTMIRSSAEVAHPGPQYFEDLHARVLAELDRPESPAFTEPAIILDLPAHQWRRPLWWLGGAAAAALMAIALVPPFLTASPSASRPSASGPLQLAQAPPVPSAPAAAPVASQLSPTPAVPEGESWDKGVIGASEVTVAEVIQSSKAGEDDRDDSPSDQERKAQEEAQARIVSLRRKALEADVLPPEVYKQLQVLKIQIVEGSNDDLRRSLRELESIVDSRVPDTAKINAYPMVRQANLYLRANDNLNSGHPDEAMSKYRQILFLDEKGPLSPVSIKACLQMADLFYSEWGNFKEAQDYYQRCVGPQAKGVLNGTEMKLVKNQLDRLERYKSNNWQALEQLHKVHHGEWTDVAPALRALLAIPGANTLLPEAARTILERMNSSGPSPTSEMTWDLYNLLAKQAGVEQNVDVRAWLELALGDLNMSQFQQVQQAIEHYGKAAASGSSEATVQARTKLNQMRDENLAGLVRNRKSE